MNVDERGAYAKLTQDAIRSFAPVKTGFGRDHIFVTVLPPEGGKEKLRVTMPFYMKLLNDGYKGFVMWGLVGKTVPIRLNSGQLIYRRATLENVGKRRNSQRDARGRIQKGNSPIAWRHPGHVAMHFVQKGVMAAMGQNAKVLVRSMIRGALSQWES